MKEEEEESGLRRADQIDVPQLGVGQHRLRGIGPTEPACTEFRAQTGVGDRLSRAERRRNLLRAERPRRDDAERQELRCWSRRRDTDTSRQFARPQAGGQRRPRHPDQLRSGGSVDV